MNASNIKFSDSEILSAREQICTLRDSLAVMPVRMSLFKIVDYTDHEREVLAARAAIHAEIERLESAASLLTTHEMSVEEGLAE